MRTVERRTKNAGSSLAYWAFVSLKRQWTIKLKFQCKSRRAYLSILEIAVDLLRSVEKVEHLEKGNYSKMVARQKCWPLPAKVRTRSPFDGSEISAGGTSR